MDTSTDARPHHLGMGVLCQLDVHIRTYYLSRESHRTGARRPRVVSRRTGENLNGDKMCCSFIGHGYCPLPQGQRDASQYVHFRPMVNSVAATPGQPCSLHVTAKHLPRSHAPVASAGVSEASTSRVLMTGGVSTEAGRRPSLLSKYCV